MSEIVFLVEEASSPSLSRSEGEGWGGVLFPEGGYTARALGESIFTEADTLEDLRARVRDAVRCHFEEGQGPAVIRLHFVRGEVTGRMK